MRQILKSPEILPESNRRVKDGRFSNGRRSSRSQTAALKAADSQTAVRAAEGARAADGKAARGKAGSFAAAESAGGRELQRKARRPACGARARRKIQREKTPP